MQMNFPQPSGICRSIQYCCLFDITAPCCFSGHAPSFCINLIFSKDSSRTTHRIHHLVRRFKFCNPDHRCCNGGSQRSWAMRNLVGSMPHGFVGQSDSRYSCLLFNGQPKFYRGVILDHSPVGRNKLSQSLGELLLGIFSVIAMLPIHLRDKAISGLPLGFGLKSMMLTDQAGPITLFGSPFANIF